MPKIESNAPRQDPGLTLLCCPCLVLGCLIKLVIAVFSRIFGCLSNLCCSDDSSLRRRATSGSSGRIPSEEIFQPFPPPPLTRSSAPPPIPSFGAPQAASSSLDRFCQEFRADVDALSLLKDRWLQIQTQLNAACPEWPHQPYAINSLFDICVKNLDIPLSGIKHSTTVALANGQSSLPDHLSAPYKEMLGKSFAAFAKALRTIIDQSLEISSDHPRTTHLELYRQHQESTRQLFEFLLGIAVKCHAEGFEATLREDLSQLD